LVVLVIKERRTVLSITIGVSAILTESWCENGVIEVIVYQLVLRSMGVSLLVLFVLRQSKPFATVWFNMAHDVTKVTFDEGCARCYIGTLVDGCAALPGGPS
jgi:hypothetical protein